MMLASLSTPYRAIVFGATGGIGSALCEQLKEDANCETLIELSRKTNPAIDFADEASLEAAAAAIKDQGPFHVMIDATGVLSDDTMQPEKALRDVTSENFIKSYTVNALGPALLLKHFAPLLDRKGKTVFASLSAKVGSIGDNQLGGWYAYRASKAALNMILKNAAIELGRNRKELVVLGLHPGTVDTGLSEHFRNQIQHEVFSPEDAACQLLQAIDGANASQSGCLMAYDGSVLPY